MKPNKFDINDIPAISYPVSQFNLRNGRVLIDLSKEGDNVVGSTKDSRILMLKGGLYVDPIEKLLKEFNGTARLVAHDANSPATTDLTNGSIVVIGNPMGMIPMVFLDGDDKRVYFLCEGYDVIGTFEIGRDNDQADRASDVQEELQAVKEKIREVTSR